MSVLEHELSSGGKACVTEMLLVRDVYLSWLWLSVLEEHLFRLIMKILVPITLDGKTHMAIVVCSSPKWPI